MSIFKKIFLLLLKLLVLVVSLFFVYLTGLVFYRDMISFEPCSVNNTDLSVQSCGKTSIGLGDVMIFILFILALTFCISILYWFIISFRKKGRYGKS